MTPAYGYFGVCRVKGVPFNQDDTRWITMECLKDDIPTSPTLHWIDYQCGCLERTESII
ncbi:hypothetical protein PAXRUDRAFT_19858 [Paxillus rubicundulus Ve08.2h10]|uniref:Uncharacterized protein n=1 Tax=Paxillus rubicundulus Ve08.2h10 TaxID=930991 RepID=A0A0D0CGS3_9AGAM|nr:hypothetical protein PAXRUDRAFT_19858 [Paxillus rubicundulus Ve08.2h10]